MFELGNVSNYFKSGYNTIEKGVLGLGQEIKKGKLGEVWDSAMGPSDEDLGRLADEESYGDVMTDDMLGEMAEKEDAGDFSTKFGAEKAGLGKGDEALKKVEKKTDFDKMAKVLASIKGGDEPTGEEARARAGGFRFDQSIYENPLIAREYKDMYMAPLYKNLM